MSAVDIWINGQPRPYLTQSTWPGLATVVDLPAAAVPAGLRFHGHAEVLEHGDVAADGARIDLEAFG